MYQREKFTEDEVRIYIGEIILALEHLHKVRTLPHTERNKAQFRCSNLLVQTTSENLLTLHFCFVRVQRFKVNEKRKFKTFNLLLTLEMSLGFLSGELRFTFFCNMAPPHWVIGVRRFDTTCWSGNV